MSNAKVSEEQILYAKILNFGMLTGLLGIIITFAIYGFGILSPIIPLDEMPKYWSMPVKDYLAASHMHTGWFWIKVLNKGDMLNFLPIAMLSGLSVVCYLAIMPIYLKRKDMPYFIICLVEVLVLCLAASGLLGTGGH